MNTQKTNYIRLFIIVFFFPFLARCSNDKEKISQDNLLSLTKRNTRMKDDEEIIRKALEIAKKSKRKGNLPFGCILVNKHGEVVLTGENTINTDGDCLAHAEINLIREASKKYDYSYLSSCSIYTSDEPCPMCTSAIYWSGIGRLVYGLSKAKYYKIVGRDNPNWVFEMPVRELLEKGGRKLGVVGPLLEDEASILHLNEL